MTHGCCATAAILILILLVLSASSCAAHYRIHPGALSTTDSAAYDALLVAQAAIDQARVDFKAGELPEKAKDPLNVLIQAYNVARDSWLTYRGAITTSGTSVSSQAYLAQLNKHLSDLADAIKRLQEAK
jgi:hypothetical protein